MNKLNHLSQKSIEILETIWGIFWARLLIAFLATVLAILVSPSSALNPCLSFMYQEPYSHRISVTQTYALNAMTQKLLARGQFPNQLDECWYANGLSCSIVSFGESK